MPQLVPKNPFITKPGIVSHPASTKICLYSNEEYTIVEQGTTFGITIFDRIVLNAEAVEEEQVIY